MGAPLHTTFGDLTRTLANMAGYQPQHVFICGHSHYQGFTTYEVLVDGVSTHAPVRGATRSL